MKPLLVLSILPLAACMESGSSKNTPLTEDAHFVALTGTYATPEACLAKEANPFVCEVSLSLCKSGRIGLRRGDIVTDGTYTMIDDGIAHAALHDSSTFEFDVQLVMEVGSNQRWIVDTAERWKTLQFDNIDCSLP